MQQLALRISRTTRFPLLANRRGAAFLLAVYFSAMALLLLGGVSLQRTTTEMRSALASRDMQQAFWLAEGGMDYAVTRIKADDLADGTYRLSQPSGARATFTVTTIGSGAASIRSVAAAGVLASGRQVRLSAAVGNLGSPLRGIISEGPIQMAVAPNVLDPLTPVYPATFKGPLTTGLGTARAILLASGISHEGDLQIGPSAPTTSTYDIFAGGMFAGTPGAWTQPIGFDGNQSGVLRYDGGDSTDSSPTIATLTMPPPVTSPYAASQCDDPLVISTPTEITDGHPLDLTPAGDGKIDLCVSYLRTGMFASGSLTLRAPTTIYVTGKDNVSVAVSGAYLSAVPPGHLPSPLAPLIEDGIKIVVTQVPTGTKAGKVLVVMPAFGGSVYAPQSHVTVWAIPELGTSVNADLTYIVGREVTVAYAGSATSVSINAAEGGSGPGDDDAATGGSLLSWTTTD